MTAEQALQAGLTRSQIAIEVANGRWEHLARGLYRLTGHAPSWEQRVWTACLATRGVASHRTAAWLHGLDGTGRFPPRDLEVVVAYDNKSTADGVTVRRSRTFTPAHASKTAGIPRTHLARTLLDLSEVLDPEHLELAFDSALRKQPDLRLWLKRLLKGMPRRGHKGIAHLDALLDEHTTAVDSALEVRVLRLIRSAGLPRPQTGLDVAEGVHIAKLDFAWPHNRPRVALMAQSERWHANTRRWKRDLTQASHLAGLGWRVLQCSADDVRDRPEELVRNLRRALSGFVAPAEIHHFVSH